MADYLVPMSNEMPDIVVAHVETPETSTKLGAKVLHQPFTPERVLDALARARTAKKQRGD